MAGSTPEQDWKYMKKVKEELLAALFERINNQSMAILKASGQSEGDKYLTLYRHIKDSDRIVACCFDDWRRSNLIHRLFQLKRHNLLKPEHVQTLSEETQQKLKALEEF